MASKLCFGIDIPDCIFDWNEEETQCSDCLILFLKRFGIRYFVNFYTAKSCKMLNGVQEAAGSNPVTRTKITEIIEISAVFSLFQGTLAFLHKKEESRVPHNA